MKKLLLFAATVFLSAPAWADTVNITSVTDLGSPTASMSSTAHYEFRGTPRIVFSVAGKTCNFVGSGSVSSPKGCNYSLTVNNSTMQLSNPVSDSSPGCTPTPQMLMNCR